MPRCAARDQAEGDGLRVTQAAALGDLDGVDVADQVGHAGVRGGQLLGVPLAAVPPGDRQVVAELCGPPARLRGDRRVGMLAELGALRSPGSTRRAGRPARAAAGSCPGRARRAARSRGRRSARAPAAAARCPRSRGCPATGRDLRQVRPAGSRATPGAGAAGGGPSRAAPQQSRWWAVRSSPIQPQGRRGAGSLPHATSDRRVGRGEVARCEVIATEGGEVADPDIFERASRRCRCELGGGSKPRSRPRRRSRSRCRRCSRCRRRRRGRPRPRPGTAPCAHPQRRTRRSRPG